jgi:beta-galactosidase
VKPILKNLMPMVILITCLTSFTYTFNLLILFLIDNKPFQIISGEIHYTVYRKKPGATA